MAEATIKEDAHRLVDQLPDDATWEDLHYMIYVKQKIEAGLREIDEGLGIPHEGIVRQFRPVGG